MRIGCSVVFLCGLAVSPACGQVAALRWDTYAQQQTAVSGQTNATLAFHATNTAAGTVTVRAARSSCGCSHTVLPQVPWRLEPGQSGPLKVVSDLRGKRGVLNKTVMVHTDQGVQLLQYRITIAEPEGDEARRKNVAEAQRNRQAVFQSDCAKCHADPAEGRQGKELFTAACAICHEGRNRASFIPELTPGRFPKTPEYWLQLITHGKEGTLMPAFANEHGGPLTKEQIESLAQWATGHHAPSAP